MREACLHQHSSNKGLEIYGQKLDVGDIIKEGDVYEHPEGWRKCGAQLIGRPVSDEAVVTVVRPQSIMTFGTT